MARRTVLGAVVMMTLFAPGIARAICGRAPPIHVWPHRGVPVPINARVLVTAPLSWRGDAELTLVTAPRAGIPREVVKPTVSAWKSSSVERIELTPLAALAPSTAYEVRTSRGEIVGAFTTSVMKDTREPTWAGVRSGRLGRTAKGVAPLECGSAALELEGDSAATDDQTTRDDVRYALWAGKPGTPIDYGAPPLTWTTAAAATHFSLGFGSTEEASMDFELPKQRPLKIGVKAVDLAGNASAASELTIE